MKICKMNCNLFKKFSTESLEIIFKIKIKLILKSFCIRSMKYFGINLKDISISTSATLSLKCNELSLISVNIILIPSYKIKLKKNHNGNTLHFCFT